MNHQQKFELLESIILKEITSPEIINKLTDKWEILRKQLTNLHKSGDFNSSKEATITKHLKNIATKIKGIRKEYEIENLKNIKQDKLIGMVILGISIATATYFIYRNFLSKYAKVCRHLLKSSRIGKKNYYAQCVNKVRKEGAKEALKILAKGKSNCSKNKNPEKCKAKFDKQIAKWKEKMS